MLKFLGPVLVIFVTSCAQNTQFPTEQQYNCDLIFGHNSDWDVITDDLARNIYRHNKTCEEI